MDTTESKGKSNLGVIALLGGVAALGAVALMNRGGTTTKGPLVTTEAASAVSQNSATLNGTIDPNGGTVSDCRFEYGPSIAYGNAVACG